MVVNSMELLNLDVIRLYGGVLLQGLAITVALTLIVILIALVLAIPVALIRMSPILPLRTAGSIYVEVIRSLLPYWGCHLTTRLT
jgi:ABC-type amino acid transport system permease subunit